MFCRLSAPSKAPSGVCQWSAKAIEMASYIFIIQKGPSKNPENPLWLCLGYSRLFKASAKTTGNRSGIDITEVCDLCIRDFAKA